MDDYGGLPANRADQAAYTANMDATLSPLLPGVKVTWSVLNEMSKYSATPSLESNMPNFTQASNDYGAMFTRL